MICKQWTFYWRMYCQDLCLIQLWTQKILFGDPTITTSQRPKPFMTEFSVNSSLGFTWWKVLKACSRTCYQTKVFNRCYKMLQSRTFGGIFPDSAWVLHVAMSWEVCGMATPEKLVVCSSIWTDPYTLFFVASNNVVTEDIARLTCDHYKVPWTKLKFWLLNKATCVLFYVWYRMFFKLTHVCVVFCRL